MITKEWIEILMASIMMLVIVGILVRAIFFKKGIGARVIQFACISFLIPAILILSIEGILNGETVGTLLGGVAGYVLSGISNYDNPLKDKDE
jgi:hypothetical protein